MFDVDRDEAINLVSDLVTIESVNPALVSGGAGEESIAQYILDYLTSLAIPARLDDVAAGRPNVIGVIAAEDEAASDPFASRAGLMLNGHLDTVSTGDMRHEPLVPEVQGDRIYGRGSLDMKGGLAMGLLALAALKRSGQRLGRPLLFTGVVDEEYMSAGTADVVRRYQADAAVVMEPTALEVNVAHKGFAWVTAEVFGRAAHGSDYREGVDAICGMGRVLAQLERLNSRYTSGPGHPLVGPPSVHASLIEGGRELSTYPDYCRLQLERRTLPGESAADFMAELNDILAQLAEEDEEFSARVTLDFVRHGYEVDEGEEVVRSLASCINRVTGEAPQYRGSSGWLDSALLGEAKIPTVIFGPGGAGAHAAEEYVDLSSVITGARVLAEMAVEMCCASAP